MEVHPCAIPRWKKGLEIKDYFEEQMGCAIYEALPCGVIMKFFLYIDKDEQKKRFKKLEGSKETSWRPIK